MPEQCSLNRAVPQTLPKLSQGDHIVGCSQQLFPADMMPVSLTAGPQVIVEGFP